MRKTFPDALQITSFRQILDQSISGSSESRPNHGGKHSQMLSKLRLFVKSWISPFLKHLKAHCQAPFGTFTFVPNGPKAGTCQVAYQTVAHLASCGRDWTPLDKYFLRSSSRGRWSPSPDDRDSFCSPRHCLSTVSQNTERHKHSQSSATCGAQPGRAKRGALAERSEALRWRPILAQHFLEASTRGASKRI